MGGRPRKTYLIGSMSSIALGLHDDKTEEVINNDGFDFKSSKCFQINRTIYLEIKSSSSNTCWGQLSFGSFNLPFISDPKIQPLELISNLV